MCAAMEVKATNESSFLKVSRPFILWCKVLGMTHFSWKILSGRVKEGSINYWSLFFFIAVLFATVTSLAFSFTNFYSGLNSKFVNLNYVILYLTQIFVIAFLALFQTFKHKRIIKFLNQIKTFDYKLSTNKWKFQVVHSSFKYMIHNFVFLALIFIFSVYVTSLRDFSLNLMNMFEFCGSVLGTIGVLFYFVLSQRFILSATSVLARIKALNNNAK